MKQIKDTPTSVTDDVTPTTKIPIQPVTASEWEQMAVSELWDQHLIVSNRLAYALQIGNVSMVKQIQTGITRLDSIIAHKSSNLESSGLI